MSHRLNKITREFNVGIHTIVEFLAKKGHKIDSNPNTKLSDELYTLLVNEFSSEKKVKRESSSVNLEVTRKKKESISLADVKKEEEDEDSVADEKPNININVVGKIDLNARPKLKVEPVVTKSEPIVEEDEFDEEPLDEEVRAEFDEQEGDFEEEDEFEGDGGEEDTDFDEDVADDAELSADDNGDEEVVIEEDGNLIRVPRTKIENNVKVIGKIDLTSLNQKTRPDKKSKEQKDKERRDRRDKDRRPNDQRPAQRGGDQQRNDRNNNDQRGGNQRDQQRNDRGGNQQQGGERPQRERIAPPITVSQQQRERQAAQEDQPYRARVDKLSGPTVVGRIELDRPSDADSDEGERRKRKRILKEKVDVNAAAPFPVDPEAAKPGAKNNNNNKNKKKKKFERREEVSLEDVDKQVKETLTQLSSKSKSKAVKLRREKRDAIRAEMEEEALRQEEESRILKVTEFISVNDIAIMMDVAVTDVISACMKLGLFVSINQRLDADTISVITEEFGFTTEFVSVEVQEAIQQEEDDEDSLEVRPPVVTVMGHVDHGKTSLLDYVRKANVIAGEAGGITQHIGAYSVKLPDGRKITFLDTPGHEAFTAMRARGAKVTDLAIIVVAADDSVMPQTVEAINHASAAGVPIVFAINKIDKQGAAPEKIKEQLANMNFLVEDWGGKYQSQEISAKKGLNVDHLLEKVLLEAELLQLRANPNKRAVGSIIESELDKGRGYVSTVLVQAGTLKVGDIMLAGSMMGKVKAMFNERGVRVKEAGPSEPVTILGLNGAPQAGDRFNVMATEKEAKELASKREQLQREQELRTHRHITLDEIGRRIAVGNFQQLNLIVKGDVDGSVEALSDSLIKLSNDEILVNVIHKAVGGITESDVMLASASDAIIVGFQVRPSGGSRRLAEKEGIDIRLYSIIYDAINEIKDAMMGMLKPILKEEVIATLEVREAFKITKVGTVAGCFVQDGKINRHAKVRIIRDGIVVYTGELGSLKRFKDDVREVNRGMECGLNITNYNDIKVGDIIEAFEEKEIQRTSL